MNSSIQSFLNAKEFGVGGASANPQKYGHRVFKALLRSGRKTFPVNPNAKILDGVDVYPTLGALPLIPESLSIVTPPEVSRRLIVDAIELGIQNVWLQPGAEDEEGSKLARRAGLNIIDDGSCILVYLALAKEV